MIKLYTFFFSAIVLFVSCKKEDSPNTPDPNGTYQQYGTPFEDIPDIEDIVMYEVNLRAFSPGGDLSGVINRLDHIKSLGVNVIWLMPIHPIGQVNSVNSPYSVKDYKAIGEEYGNLEDLRRLTNEAHARGMAVIMDWIANHTAWDNPWIENKSWYTQNSSGTIIHPPGTNWLDVADLNFSNYTMRAAMIDAMTYWIYEANIDGYRCDYADGVPFNFWSQAFDSLRMIPNRSLVLFAEGSRSDHFQAGFDLSFGWQFYGQLKNVFEGEPVSKLIQAHNNEYSSISTGKSWVRFSTNHDESAWDETPMVLFNGKEGALAASVAAVFTGGVPLIYGSQEVGTVNPVPFFYNSNINWNANPDMLNSYKSLISFYNSSETSRRGSNTFYTNSDVLCMKKSGAGEDLLIMVNVRDSTLMFDVPAEHQFSTWTDVFDDETYMLNSEVELEPYAYMILRQ